jgi:hypothetical protein
MVEKYQKSAFLKRKVQSFLEVFDDIFGLDRSTLRARMRKLDIEKL